MNINNLSRGPVDFRMAQIEVSQIVGENEFATTVVTYQMLAQEEKSRQVATAIIGGLAAGANAYGASCAGYGHYTTPSGKTGTLYSPTANAIAQGNAAAQNEAMIGGMIEQG